MAGIRLGSGESARAFKGIICDDISEFESYMPSHAVASLRARQASWIELRFKSARDYRGLCLLAREGLECTNVLFRPIPPLHKLPPLHAAPARDEQTVSKQRRTATGRGQKRFQLMGQSWHVKKTCSETVEQIIGGRNKLSAGNVPVPPTNTRQKRRIARSSVSFSLLCVLCHAIARALGRRFRCSLDDAREELT
jgi:hypothetical protein